MIVAPPPPRLEDMRLGTQLVAGLGVATVIPDLDFETYSEAGYVWDDAAGRWTGPPGAPGSTKGLPLTGTEPYVKHPTFDIVWMAYDLKDGGGRRRWHPGMPPPMDLFGYVLTGGLIEAWSVQFERWVWKHYCVPRLGWPEMRDDQWRCAQAKARASGYPGALGKAGAVLGLQTQKDPRGTALMKKLSMPRNPTKTDPRRRVMPLYRHPGYPEGVRAPERKRIDSDYADTMAYGAYNETDIASEAEASSLIPDLEGEELLWWQTHERINQRGVHIDRAGVENCIAVVEQAFAKYNGELIELTGIDAASKVQQLLGWLHSRNVHLDSLDEESVEAALAWTWLPPDARRVLEIRAAIGSASVKKLFAIRNRLSDDDRLRDLYVFSGARTGRSTGEGPQPTNLAKAGPDTIKCGCGKHYGTHAQACPFCGMPRAPDARVHEWSPEVAEQALEVIATRSLAWVERVYGDALHAIAGCLRALFDAAPGHDLISTDYNSIEAVGLAMLAGEAWRIEVFETHGKIYEASAAAAFRIPFEEFAQHKAETGQHHPLRQKGKGLELACVSRDTQVLTDRGYVAIVELRHNDMLWDGIEWVNHAGVVSKGTRPVISLGGARMTPDHLVLCGTSWLEARRLASSASTRSLALETGSENLPFVASLEVGTLFGFRSSAVAERSLTKSFSPTSSTAELPVAIVALRKSPSALRKSTSVLLTLFQERRTAVVSWVASLRQSAAATTLPTASTETTGRGESKSTQSGEPTRGSSWSTSFPFLGGTTLAWTWTAQMLTETTNRGICGSSLGGPTNSTKEKSEPYSNESMTSSDVYDIARAGPRNRFTIRTNDGHLIVHNCGYQGWLGAAKAFDIPGTDDEIKDDILAWRAASPSIEFFWGGQTKGKENGIRRVGDRWDRTKHYFGVEGMAIQAVEQPGQWHDVLRMDGTNSGVSFQCRANKLYCRLPSGRTLTYHDIELENSDRGGFALAFWGWNTNPKNGPVGWIRINTWGGRLVENINQAVCRDILRRACIVLEAAGYPVVLHVYDEIVAEVLEGTGTIEEFEHLVTEVVRRLLAWAAAWPIRAPGGYRAKRYRKG